MQKIFIAMAMTGCLWFGTRHAFCAERWCAVTEKDVIPVENIDCLLSTDGETCFNILLANGDIVSDVYSMTFAFRDVHGEMAVPNTLLDKSIIVMNNVLHVSNASRGAMATVMTADGREIVSEKVVAGKCDIDISGLAPGLYIFGIDGKSVKFVKK